MKLTTSYSNSDFYIERNKKIMKLRSEGKSISEVSDIIGTGSRNVERIILELRQDNNCVNELQLVCRAIRQGVI